MSLGLIVTNAYAHTEAVSEAAGWWLTLSSG